MKKSFEVNLGGRIFNFDDDAYELLNNYMESLKECFSKQDGGEEIIADIEVRLGELCETRMREGADRIVNFTMVDEFITRMGRPESLAQEAVGAQDTAEDGAAPEDNAQQKREPWRDAMLLGKKLFRDTRNGLLGGVFSGLAAYTGINAWLLRVVAILLFFWLAGIVIPIVYIVAWIILPMALSVTDLLRLSGHGNVELFSYKLCFHCLFLKYGLFLGYSRFDSGSDLVCDLTYNGSFLGGELTHAAKNGGELTLFTEIFDSCRFERGIICLGRADKVKRFGLYTVQGFLHFVCSFQNYIQKIKPSQFV